MKKKEADWSNKKTQPNRQDHIYQKLQQDKASFSHL